MGTTKDGWGYARVAIALVALIAASALLAVGCGGSSECDRGGGRFTGEAFPNVDRSGTRNSKGPINASNVKDLEEAWTVPITGQGAFGSYAASPVVVNGVVYSQDLGSNVQAIDLSSGEVLWSRNFELPSLAPNGVVVAAGTGRAIDWSVGEVLGARNFDLPSLGPNGVVVADGRVYGATSSEAFALD